MTFEMKRVEGAPDKHTPFLKGIPLPDGSAVTALKVGKDVVIGLLSLDGVFVALDPQPQFPGLERWQDADGIAWPQPGGYIAALVSHATDTVSGAGTSCRPFYGRMQVPGLVTEPAPGGVTRAEFEALWAYVRHQERLTAGLRIIDEDVAAALHTAATALAAAVAALDKAVPGLVRGQPPEPAP